MENEAKTLGICKFEKTSILKMSSIQWLTQAIAVCGIEAQDLIILETHILRKTFQANNKYFISSL